MFDKYYLFISIFISFFSSWIVMRTVCVHVHRLQSTNWQFSATSISIYLHTKSKLCPLFIRFSVETSNNNMRHGINAFNSLTHKYEYNNYLFQSLFSFKDRLLCQIIHVYKSSIVDVLQWTEREIERQTIRQTQTIWFVRLVSEKHWVRVKSESGKGP